jgi:3-dehydroquinate dehydratase/shikimate dehydrogenase
MRARLCVTVTVRTTDELRRRRDEAIDADLVELRVDTVADPDAAGALAGRRQPVIVTCRPAWEGGSFTGSDEERQRVLLDARRLGAEYVDVEWKAGMDDLIASRGGQGIVVSRHDFDQTPRDLPQLERAMRATGAEVVKLAVTAHSLADCIRLRSAATGATGPVVAIAMGEAGLASRVLATSFNSCWTYAGDAIAPGQIPAGRLLHGFGYRGISASTRIYGVVGRPIAHSLSPAMHNAALKAAGIDAVYLPLAARDFDDFLAFADGFGLAGASVTAPFKIAAFERSDECDAMSRRIQSVNTLRRRNGRWEARNTDVEGFLVPLQAALDVRGARATVLGAGGAARAAVSALCSAGASVEIAARDPDRGRRVADLMDCTAVAWPPRPGSWDVLVNATPVGTAPALNDSPLPGGPFTGRLVYDLVYNPIDTRLLREARRAGCRTIGGLEMLVAQAQRQFEWWTGVAASSEVLRTAALRALARADHEASASARDVIASDGETSPDRASARGGGPEAPEAPDK